MNFGKEYFITSYSQLSDYLNFFINDDKDKQIKYIFTNGSNSKDGEMIDADIFIVFDNDAVLKIDYKFYSLMYIEYTWIQNLSLNDKEYNNENFYLDLDVSNARIESFEIERLVGEYEINPSSGTVRPDKGDYFKKIAFKLSNGNNLCICAEDAETDGYCDIWTEDSIEKIEENMFNYDETTNADWIRKWAFANLNNKEGNEENGLIPFNIQRFNEFSLAYHHDLMDMAGLWGFKDKKGNVVVEPKFLFEPIAIEQKYIVCIGSGWVESDEWSKGHLWCNDMKWGVIDLNFNEVIPFEYDEIDYLDGGNIPYFTCYKYKYETTGLKWATIFDYDGKIVIPEKYNDVGYYIENDQLVVYKDRERFPIDSTVGYAGIYDFKLNKEIIKPNKYREMDYLDYNIFLVSDDEDNMEYATIINQKGEVIGKEKIWDLVFKVDNTKGHQYEGKTMNKRYYYFNIKDSKIVDQVEITKEGWEGRFHIKKEKNYDFNSWDVPIIQEPEELMTKLKELDVKGRKIEAIKCIGLCYNLTEDNIENAAYTYYKENGSKDFERKSHYKNIPLDTPYIRYVEIDEPIIIYLDNGDRLEIDYSEASSLKISKNTLPRDLQCGTNLPNADANIIFSRCLQKNITGFEVEMSDELYDDFTGSHGISEPINQKSYISNFKIGLEDNLYIKFSSFFDYGEVEIYEGRNKSTILWKELKKGIRN